MPSASLVARLRAAGCVYAEEEAALLETEAEDPEHLAAMLGRRETGLPLEQVLGWADFAGVRVSVAPGVFVPRRRSGLLVDLADEVLDHLEGAVVVDLCCGTGAIAAAVAQRHPRAEIYAADLDPAAVATARRNLGPDRVLAGDLYDALPERLRGRVDLLLVNAPYVPTAAIDQMPPEARDHEHHLALDGGEDGLAVHRRLARGAGDWLGPRGEIVIESSGVQAPATAQLLQAAGLHTELRCDEQVSATAVRAWNGPRETAHRR